MKDVENLEVYKDIGKKLRLKKNKRLNNVEEK